MMVAQVDADSNWQWRANPGCDSEGPYYVGADLDGKLIWVRPDGPTRGRAIGLGVAPDPRRSAVCSTCLPDRSDGFVLFTKNQRTPGAGVRAKGNSWVELQYISLPEPAKIIPVERQETPPVNFASMVVGFVSPMNKESPLRADVGGAQRDGARGGLSRRIRQRLATSVAGLRGAPRMAVYCGHDPLLSTNSNYKHVDQERQPRP